VTDGLFTVAVPHMGVSVTEVTIVAWHHQPGDAVEAGQSLCDVSTDKVDTDIVAQVSGVLARIMAADGETVAVGDPVAEIALSADFVAERGRPAPLASRNLVLLAAAGRDENGSFDPVAAAAVIAAPTGNGVVVSPVARRLAADHNIDLAAVEGSGRCGHIRKCDVLAAIAGRSSEPDLRAQSAIPMQASLAPPGSSRSAAGALDLPAGYDDVPHEIIATSRMRRATAEHMTRSRQTSAHMTTEVDVDLWRLMQIRARLNQRSRAAGSPKLSFLPFVARAACATLAEYPDLNATFQQERAIRWKTVNLGIAVDTPDGLIVPVIRTCELLTAPAIGARITDLAARARSRRLRPDDLAGGTFTISNPGSFGAVSAPAILNQPQVGLLGLPTIVRRPWVIIDDAGAEAIAIRPIVRLALTFDHRAVDGGEATRCVAKMGKHLETWPIEAYV
jgi:pyruvate dehydrogenase E2 component (dihydrolipoamide acetyltransferase)